MTLFDGVIMVMVFGGLFYIILSNIEKKRPGTMAKIKEYFTQDAPKLPAEPQFDPMEINLGI